MTPPEKVLFSWSGGKDSALALHEVLKDSRFEVVSLLTTVAESFRRISHHGVREELLDEQARAIRIPLEKVYFPVHPGHACTNSEYEEIMGRVLGKFREQGVCLVAHGDIFLQDLRDYRERNLARIGMKGLFPLWQRSSGDIVRSFIEQGFKARICCVDGVNLGAEFVGRSLDEDFIRDLPANVDPAGENGEYHSFVYDGPIFRWPVGVRVGEVVERDKRFYADLLLERAGAETAGSEAIPPV